MFLFFLNMNLEALTRRSWGSLCLAPAGHARCFRVNTSLRNKDENLNSILALYWCYDNHMHIPVINSHDLQLLGFSSWVLIKLERAAYSILITMQKLCFAKRSKMVSLENNSIWLFWQEFMTKLLRRSFLFQPAKLCQLCYSGEDLQQSQSKSLGSQHW